MSKKYEFPHQLDPYVLTDLGDLEPLIRKLVEVDNHLRGQVHPLTQVAVADLVRDMNCYYSNLIEGHRTLPIDIARARHHDFSSDKDNFSRQKLAAAHLETEAAVSEWLNEGLTPYTSEFIQKAHFAFCKKLPPEMLILQHGAGSKKSDEIHWLAPGQWRDKDVKVSRHLPPTAASIASFMARFEETQKPRGGNLLQVANAIAGHHRLTWIHPFADGNGRISRIATDAQLKHLGVNVAGLWSWSRGLAKNKDKYMLALAEADNEREGDLDGRGNLSLRTLRAFVRMGLEIAIDQTQFMSQMLELDTLKIRVQNHFVRERPDMAPQAARIMLQTLAFGEVRRGDAKVASGLGERKAQDLVKQLMDEGYLTSLTPKGAVRAAFPLHAVGTFFPNLFPAGSIEVNPQLAIDYVAEVIRRQKKATRANSASK